MLFGKAGTEQLRPPESRIGLESSGCVTCRDPVTLDVRVLCNSVGLGAASGNVYSLMLRSSGDTCQDGGYPLSAAATRRR